MANFIPILPEFIPYWAWNRLESRPRRKEFKNALKAEIHDATWMLGRQWQMGEFEGNDTGSGILAHASMGYFDIDGVGPQGQAINPYNKEAPLEAIVEPIFPRWSIRERLLIGNKWMYFLRKKLSTTDFTAYKRFFLTHDLAIQKKTLATAPSESEIISSFQAASKPGLNDLIDCYTAAGISLDGAQIYQLLTDPYWENKLNTLFGALAGTALVSGMDTARLAFLEWLQKQYHIPVQTEFWNKESLEYRFSTEWQTKTSEKALLDSHTYQNKSLDWYSLKQVNDRTESVEEYDKTIQIILSKSRFPGMPNSRWWEMENGSVNFCEVNADTTDIAKILATQFALVYQDDWFVIPFKVPVGSYSSVKGILVTDVFGVTTFISDYTVSGYDENGFFQSADDWKKWQWMRIKGTYSGTAGSQIILPVAHKKQQSDPIEEVVFMRDEMADVVWAIEKIIPDELGKGMDGFRFSNVFREKMRQFRPTPSGGSGTPVSLGTALPKYKIADYDVPENCIPFMPVHTPDSNRSIRFQRAAMPRILEGYDIDLIRPNTSILKSAPPPPQSAPGAYVPYYINEEELARAGLIIQTRFQRTRWYNGKIVSWLGYQRRTGRGSTSSGLEYDMVKDE